MLPTGAAAEQEEEAHLLKRFKLCSAHAPLSGLANARRIYAGEMSDDLVPSDDDCWGRNDPPKQGRARYSKWTGTASEWRKEWLKTPRGIEYLQRSRETAKLSGARARHSRSDAAKASNKRSHAKREADPGRKLMARIGSRMSVALKTPHENSGRLRRYTEFPNSQAIADHFESLFEPWMSWDNYGPYNPKGPRTWNIGHRIPLSKYDASNESDFKRCWSKANLFSQCSKENNENRDKMPDDEILNTLVDVWPLNWG